MPFLDYKHSDAEAFMLEGQSLVPTVEDIYFFDWPLQERGTSQFPDISYGAT
jgi:hypothetical protein